MVPQAAACVKLSCTQAAFQEIIDASNWRHNQEFNEAQRQHQLGQNWKSSQEQLHLESVSSSPFVSTVLHGSSRVLRARKSNARYLPGLSWVVRVENGIGTCVAWNTGASGRLL